VLNGVRVLVVEDDFIIAMDLESALVDAGAEVIGPCRTVRDAVAATIGCKLAAAVLDVRLGGETVAPVASELARRGIPFLFYTGQIETDPIRVEWPACTIVVKPASSRAIVGAVAALLQR
jgi:DNA-binding response OmpR family regulator